MSGRREPGGGQVRLHAHHVHVPGGLRHRRVRLRGEPVVGRHHRPRLHADGEGGAGEVRPGGERVGRQGVGGRFTPTSRHRLLLWLQVATKTLPFYKEYFDVPYPLPKIDLIAIADFAAGEPNSVVFFPEMCDTKGFLSLTGR